MLNIVDRVETGLTVKILVRVQCIDGSWLEGAYEGYLGELFSDSLILDGQIDNLKEVESEH